MMKTLFTSIGVLLLPLVTFAADETSVPIEIGDDIGQISTGIGNIFAAIAPILIAVVIIYLLYGAFLIATAGGNEDKQKKGKDILLYGLIGVFLIVSVVGLVNFVLNSFSIGDETQTIITPPAPVIEGSVAPG